MICSFTCIATERLFRQGHAPSLMHLGRRAWCKLHLLNSAVSLQSLRAARDSAFAHADERVFKHSLYINPAWRLYFSWSDEGPCDVAIAPTTPEGEWMFPPHPLPPHPGEILRGEYLAPLGLSAAALAKALQVDEARVTGLLEASLPLDAEMALRLTRYFGGDAMTWLNLQQSYDLQHTKHRQMAHILQSIQPYAAP